MGGVVGRVVSFNEIQGNVCTITYHVIDLYKKKAQWGGGLHLLNCLFLA